MHPRPGVPLRDEQGESLILAVGTYYRSSFITLFFLCSLLSIFSRPFFDQVSDATVRSFLALSVREKNEGQKPAQVKSLPAYLMRSHHFNFNTVCDVFLIQFYDILCVINLSLSSVYIIRLSHFLIFLTPTIASITMLLIILLSCDCISAL